MTEPKPYAYDHEHAVIQFLFLMHVVTNHGKTVEQVVQALDEATYRDVLTVASIFIQTDDELAITNDPDRMPNRSFVEQFYETCMADAERRQLRIEWAVMRLDGHGAAELTAPPNFWKLQA